MREMVISVFQNNSNCKYKLVEHSGYFLSASDYINVM